MSIFDQALLALAFERAIIARSAKFAHSSGKYFTRKAIMLLLRFVPRVSFLAIPATPATPATMATLALLPLVEAPDTLARLWLDALSLLRPRPNGLSFLLRACASARPKAPTALDLALLPFHSALSLSVFSPFALAPTCFWTSFRCFLSSASKSCAEETGSLPNWSKIWDFVIRMVSP